MKLNVSAAWGWGLAAASQGAMAFVIGQEGWWEGIVPIVVGLLCAYQAGRDRSRVCLEPQGKTYLLVGSHRIEVDP